MKKISKGHAFKDKNGEYYVWLLTEGLKGGTIDEFRVVNLSTMSIVDVPDDDLYDFKRKLKPVDIEIYLSEKKS